MKAAGTPLWFMNISLQWYFPRAKIVCLYLSGLYLAATNVWFLPTQRHLTDSTEGNSLLCKAIKVDENDDFVLSSSSFFPWALPTWPPHNIILLSCSFEYNWRNPLAEEESASSQLTSTFSPSSLALAHSTPLRWPSADLAIPCQSSSSQMNKLLRKASLKQFPFPTLFLRSFCTQHNHAHQ